eukprot:3545695-Amphidinium_carterae.1
MFEQSFRGLCEKHARASSSLSKGELSEAHMLCEVLKSFLQGSAQAALESVTGGVSFEQRATGVQLGLDSCTRQAINS